MTARFGHRIASDVEQGTADLAELREGFWAVVVTFEGEVTAIRVHCLSAMACRTRVRSMSQIRVAGLCATSGKRPFPASVSDFVGNWLIDSQTRAGLNGTSATGAIKISRPVR